MGESRTGVSSWFQVVADPIRLEIVSALSRQPDLTIADLVVAAPITEQTLRRHLETLLNAGVVELQPGRSDGETPGRPAARFRLPEPIFKDVRLLLEPASSPSKLL